MLALKGAKALATAKRKDLIGLFEHYRQMSDEWIRRQVLQNNRLDILAIAVLGYQVEPFHLAMLQFQFQHPQSLQLVFRGAGKTTLCTITKTIHYLLKNPNLRILLASKTAGNAEAFLKEVKGHFESNDKLAALFGRYYDPNLVSKWDNREIEVLPRTRVSKEASVTCVGVDGTIVSKHYDVIISDDLVDEDNARTQYMREKTKTWFYQTLDPCLEPPDSTVEHRGEHHILGTRYHWADLYGHLLENEYKAQSQIIPALNENEESPWPEKYPPEWLAKKKANAGMIIFNAQYQCDTEAMKGEIFKYDDCQQHNDIDYPSGLRVFMGVDLAVGENTKNDQFAIVVIGLDAADHIWVLDHYAGFDRFSLQQSRFKEMYRLHDPVLAGLEVVAYQKVLHQVLKEQDVNLRIYPIHTDKDKITRAWKLSPVFEEKRMHFRKGMNTLIDQLVLFPNHPHDDLFDALDHAVTASRRRVRKRRNNEPGVI